MAQWALRWILDHPEVTTVIPGATKVSHVESNMQASALEPLSASVRGSLRNLYDQQIQPVIRGRY
jgi:aryl-alcohol dehydrogenase-like predicted oxidoreductase